MNKKILYFGFCVIGLFTLLSYLDFSHGAKAAGSVHVSENFPEGVVMTNPEDLGGGIYLIKVKVGIGEKPIQYPAVTAQPDQFPVGSKVRLKNVTAAGTNAFHDMFHVAVPVLD